MSNNKFPAKNKIKGSLGVQELFKIGEQEKIFPLKSIYKTEDSCHPLDIKFAVSVPKKLFKRAVDRNQIKRYLRESIRLNRKIFIQSSNPKGLSSIIIIYISKEMPEQSSINEKIIELFNRLNKQ